jgi:hypothetical protein
MEATAMTAFTCQLKWSRHYSNEIHYGPVVKLTFDEMEKIVDYFNETYKNADHDIVIVKRRDSGPVKPVYDDYYEQDQRKIHRSSIEALLGYEPDGALV